MSNTATVEQLAQVQEILAQLDRQSRPDQTNRRKTARLTVRMPLDMIVLSNSAHPTLEVFTRNISTAGIGFVSRRLFKNGEYLTLEFSIPGSPPKLVLTHVTFCRYIKAGLYEVGAAFIEAVAVNPALIDPIPPHWAKMADPKITPPQPTTNN